MFWRAAKPEQSTPDETRVLLFCRRTRVCKPCAHRTFSLALLYCTDRLLRQLLLQRKALIQRVNQASAGFVIPGINHKGQSELVHIEAQTPVRIALSYAGCCWVMQCIAPNPQIKSPA